jgi:hypothetical protein
VASLRVDALLVKVVHDVLGLDGEVAVALRLEVGDLGDRPVDADHQFPVRAALDEVAPS